MSGACAGVRRITSAPPPPGRCTSSSTTSGWCCDRPRRPPVDVGGLGDDVDRRCRARRGRRRGTSRGRRRSRRRCGRLIGCLLSGRGRGRCSRTSVPSPGSTADLGGAAVPVHPVRRCCRARPAGPRGRASGSKPAPRSRTNTSTPRSVHLGVDVDRAGAGVLGGVDHRLAGGEHERAQRPRRRSQSPTVTTLDGDAVGVLDLGRRRAQRAGERVGAVGRLAVEQPGPQVALLGAGQPGDGRRRRRRSSGSGPGSAAPSRAGARPRRRAPGCGPARRARRSGREASRQHPRADHERRARRTPSSGRDQRRRGRRRRCPSRTREQHERRDQQHDAGADPGVRRPAAAAERPPGPGRSGRWCRASARAAPRRPAATAARRRRRRAAAARTRRRRRRPPATSEHDAEGERGQRDQRAGRRPAPSRRRPGRLPWRVAASRPGRRVVEVASRRAAPATGRRTARSRSRRARSRPGTPPAPTAPGRRGAGPARPRRRRASGVVGVAVGATGRPAGRGDGRRGGGQGWLMSPQSSHSARPADHEDDPDRP